jgi:hypothetical protein
MPWITDQATGRGYLFAGEQITLEPGTYHVAAEVKDMDSETFGSFRDSVQVRRFNRNTLEVSSLLLARRVVERDDGATGRARFMVLPNPLGKCERNGQAHFYFEVYNLARDEFGGTYYDVAYQVRGLVEGDQDGKPNWTTAVSHTYNGTRSWEPHTLALDLGGIGAGPLAFRVLVSDLLGMQEATSSTTFRVTW